MIVHNIRVQNETPPSHDLAVNTLPQAHNIHDGVEEAREEDNPAIRACQEEAVAAREEAGPGSARPF
jgi:hypothetical protein